MLPVMVGQVSNIAFQYQFIFSVFVVLNATNEVVHCNISNKITTISIFCLYPLCHLTGLEQLPEDTFSISHHEEDLDLPHYDFATLAKATNDFSFTHFLGEGGYGPVYRVTLSALHEI